MLSDPVADSRGDPAQLSGSADGTWPVRVGCCVDSEFGTHVDHGLLECRGVVGESESDAIERDDGVGGQLTGSVDQGATAAVGPVEFNESCPEFSIVDLQLRPIAFAADHDHRRMFAEEECTESIGPRGEFFCPQLLEFYGRVEIDATEQVDLERIGPAGLGSPVDRSWFAHGGIALEESGLSTSILSVACR